MALAPVAVRREALFATPSGPVLVAAAVMVESVHAAWVKSSDQRQMFVRAPSLKYPFASNRGVPDVSRTTNPDTPSTCVATVARVKVGVVLPSPNAIVDFSRGAQNVRLVFKCAGIPIPGCTAHPRAP